MGGVVHRRDSGAPRRERPRDRPDPPRPPASFLAAVVCALASLGSSSPVDVHSAAMVRRAQRAAIFPAAPLGTEGGYRIQPPPGAPLPGRFPEVVQRRRRGCREVGRPIVHQPAAPLEQVRPRVGRLDPVADHVRQRRLDDLPRVVRLRRRPVPEAGAEAMRHGRDVQLPQQLRQERALDPVAPAVREHERIAVSESAPRRGPRPPARSAGPGARGASSCAWRGWSTHVRPCRSRPTSPAAPRPTAPPSRPGTRAPGMRRQPI